MQKRAPKGTSTFPACSGLGEKIMAKKEGEKMRKREQKDAKKKQWIPDGTVTGGKSSAEKACKMSKKMQKGNLTPPWGRRSK